MSKEYASELKLGTFSAKCTLVMPTNFNEVSVTDVVS